MVIGPFLAKSEAPENSSKGGPNLGEMMKCSGLSFLRGNTRKFLEGKIHRSEGLRWSKKIRILLKIVETSIDHQK